MRRLRPAAFGRMKNGLKPMALGRLKPTLLSKKTKNPGHLVMTGVM